jgi:hypothetical protein
MTDFDYKKYSLENLEKWMEDALSSAEASPQEIYDTIQRVVSENYYHHKHHASRAYELMEKLNGGVTFTSCDKDDPSPECQGAWNDFWEENYYPEEYKLENIMPPWGHSDMEALQYPEEVLNAMCDEAEKVKKWRLPVEVDGLTGECYIQLPDDLLEVTNLKEGDQVEWIDRKDGSFELRKVTK